MYKALTDKQKAVLQFIIETQQTTAHTPSIREICNHINVSSTATVQGHLDKLEEAGYISRSAQKRSIEVVKDIDGLPFTLSKASDDSANLPELMAVPVIGRVAAGQPLLAVENIEDYFPIPVEYARNSDVFMLRVRGESMINAGIFDRDLILVRRQNTARNGDIVVALIDDSATVKTFYKESDHIRLQPENDSMDPIIVSECAILGTVIGLYRKF